MAQPSFRVIIVGGGPTGLSLANLLKAANIDFLLLEKHKSVLSDIGASIGLWPHSSRILAQLGLEEIAEESNVLTHSRGLLEHDGTLVGQWPSFEWLIRK